MKRKEYDEARRMRLEDGESVKVIARKLGVALSSASKWCSDIQLTEEQKSKLALRNPVFRGQCAGADANKKNAMILREKYQVQGRELARQYVNDIEFAIGCALYWAEGDKSRTSVSISNMDVELIIRVKNWFVKYFKCNNDDFKIRINAYLDSGLSINDINKYWIGKLGLTEKAIGGFTLRSKYYTGLNRKKKMPYGCCSLTCCDVEKKQMIFGAIRELMNIEIIEGIR